jgi:hypothetical protein
MGEGVELTSSEIVINVSHSRTPVHATVTKRVPWRVVAALIMEGVKAPAVTLDIPVLLAVRGKSLVAGLEGRKESCESMIIRYRSYPRAVSVWERHGECMEIAKMDAGQTPHNPNESSSRLRNSHDAIRIVEGIRPCATVPIIHTFCYNKIVMHNV